MTPPLRASHADRDLAVDILCAAAGDGRLTAAELDERLETALTARTISELAAVTADLPGGNTLQAACLAWPGENLPDVLLIACPLGTPLQAINCFIHNDDHARTHPAANANMGPVIRDGAHIEVWLEPGPSPAPVTGQNTMADADQLTASRWALLQSLTAQQATTIRTAGRLTPLVSGAQHR